MKKNPFKKIAVALLLVIVALVLAFGSCAMYRKITAAKILSKTKLEFNALTLNSVSINKDLFPQRGTAGSFLPNPQVITLVQDFARGILTKEIGKADLTVTLTAQNQSDDSLWIKKISAAMDLDTLMNLPVNLKDSVLLVPGENKIEVVTQMPLDKRLFKLMEISQIKFKGNLDASLVKSDIRVPFDFDLSRTITQEEKQELTEKARTSVLNGIVNDWVGALLPNQ